MPPGRPDEGGKYTPGVIISGKESHVEMRTSRPAVGQPVPESLLAQTKNDLVQLCEMAEKCERAASMIRVRIFGDGGLTPETQKKPGEPPFSPEAPLAVVLAMEKSRLGEILASALNTLEQTLTML